MSNCTLYTFPDEYTGKFPFFRKPIEYGYFSHDASRSITFDAKSLKALKLPKKQSGLNFDLSSGFDSYIQKENSTTIDDLLRWLMRNRHKLVTNSENDSHPNRYHNGHTHTYIGSFYCYSPVPICYASGVKHAR